MPLIFNGTEVDTLVFNGVEADSYIHNGVEVFSSAVVASNILFTVNYLFAGEIGLGRSFIYRINYDSTVATEIGSTPTGTTISSMVWDPGTNAYYMSERRYITTGFPRLEYTIKRSNNNGSSWQTQTVIQSENLNAAQGKLAVLGTNNIEFYIGIATIDTPGALRGHQTTNGSTWSVKWTSVALTSEIVGNIVPVGPANQVAAMFLDTAGTVKARILWSNGVIQSTLTDSAGSQYWSVFWSVRLDRLYWFRADNANYQLRTTNFDLSNVQIIDSSNDYMSMGDSSSTEIKLYYGNGYAIRSHDGSTVLHEHTVAEPIWTTKSQGRHIIAGSITGGSTPRLTVSYNRGVNWFDIGLPNHVPASTFVTVGNITY